MLNAMVHEYLRARKTQGVQLPRFKKHVIAQYVDDINFTIKASQAGLSHLASVLDLFNWTSCFQINDSKFMAFWLGGKKKAQPAWTKDFN
jgi:hypothetical protein